MGAMADVGNGAPEIVGEALGLSTQEGRGQDQIERRIERLRRRFGALQCGEGQAQCLIVEAVAIEQGWRCLFQRTAQQLVDCTIINPERA
jgi:hypothetical protein